MKPGNIFLRNSRALLCDFGIARWQDEGDPGHTTPGQRIGTPRYMSPEQRDGEACTRRTDVYAAGLVLWEACSGVRWPPYQPPDPADWSRVPASLAAPVRRALALSPMNRWADAGEFAAALRRPRRIRQVLWMVAALPALVVAAFLLRRGPHQMTGLLLHLVPFEVRGAPGRASLGDSVSHALARVLSGSPDLRVRETRRGERITGAVQLAGTVTLGPRGIRLELSAAGSGPLVRIRAGSSSEDDWPALVNSLADSLVRRIWEGELGADKWLPLAALPKTADGLGRWHVAERLYAQGRWDDADSAYRSAERADPTCLLYSYRVIDIRRWLGGGGDSARLARIYSRLDSFPPHYRALITAQQLPWPERYDSLKNAVATWPDFFLASFLLGDELFHRGPLHGHLRHDALEPMTRAQHLNPGFAPANEHLAWVLMSEGGAAETRRALDSVPPEGAGAGLSRVLRLMLQIGYRWRFGTPEEATAITKAVLGTPGIAEDFRTPSGGRMMMTLDTPDGAVGLGRALEGLRGNPEAVRSGLLAEAHGFAALGRLDSLRVVGNRLGLHESDRSLPLYVLELEAALAWADPDSRVRPDPALLSALEAYVVVGAERPALRQRAAWMLTLLARRAGDTGAVARFRALLADEPPPGIMRGEVDAWDAVLQGDTARAGRLLAGLPASDLNHSDADPLEDAVLRLVRVDYESLGGGGGRTLARESLRWHEHLQLVDYPIGDPQPGEAAWALGTLMRWRRALLLEAGGQPGLELCATYGAVARLWHNGQPPYAARADSARRRFLARGCGAPT